MSEKISLDSSAYAYKKSGNQTLDYLALNILADLFL